MKSRSRNETFQSLLKELAQHVARNERRQHPRHPWSIAIRIQPLNLDFRPDGEAFWVTTRDVCDRGMGIINPEPIQHEYVKIELPDCELRIIARVCHNTSIGVQYPLYLVGLQFIDE